MKRFSWRYRSLLGVEGELDTDARTLTLRIVILGGVIGVTVGVAVSGPSDGDA